MAAPITHIVLTDKIYQKYFSDKDKQLFFVGTVFPDIRYLGVIKREKTHLKISELNKVINEKSPFLAGVKFHDLLDWLRNCFLKENQQELFKLLTENNLLSKNYTKKDLRNLNRLSKLLEDQLIYNKVKDWQEYINYLDNTYQEEIEFGVKKKDVKHWHQILQNYFKQLPNQETRKEFFKELNWTEKKIINMENYLKKMSQSQQIRQFLTRFYNQFYNLTK
jgi:hypothetical protein